MHLLEVAAQHVRGLSPAARAALPRGYVAVQPPGPAAATGGALSLGGLLAALLYPDGRGGDAAFAVAGTPGGGAQAKVALTFTGGDGQTYRLVRQLGGAGTLQRLDAATGAFAEVTRDSQQMGQYLRAQAQLPQRNVFEGLFVLSPAQLPSRSAAGAAGAAGSAGAAGASGPSSSGARRAASAAPVDAAEVQVRIAALEQELETSTRIDKLQFRQDALAGETFELEERLKGVAALRAALADAEASHAAAPTAQSLGLPHDIEERIARHPAQVQKLEESLARLDSEREELQHAADVDSAPEPFWKDPKFVGGAALGAVCLGGGLLADGALRYLALLDIPAFGFAALVALKWVDDLRDSQQGSRREGMRAAREKKVRESFEAEARPVKEAMAKLRVESPQEVLDLLARRAQYAVRVAELKAELAAAEADPQYVEAAQGLERARREVEALGEQMHALSGGYVRDPREVERELARARESLHPRAQVEEEAPEVSTGASSQPATAGEDPAPKLLALAADAAHVEAAEVTAAVKGRAGQYLMALSDRRWSGLELDGHGRARLLGAEGPVPAGEVAGADRDLLYVALRLTLVEWLARRVRMPVVLEAGAPGLDPQKDALLGKMLKQLAQSAQVQVLHVSPPEGCAALADGVAAL